MKKKLALIMAASMAITGLSACAPKTNEETTTAKNEETTTASSGGTETQTTTSSSSGENVTITFWDFPNYNVVDDELGKYERQMADAFEAKNPGIKVNVEMIDFKSGPEKITTAITGGTAPDLVFDAPGRIIDWGKSGVLASLNDMFTDDVLKDVPQAVLDTCKTDKYWMYPTNTAPFMMAFNKDMLTEYNLMDMLNLEGDRRWTVEQYEALLRALKEKGEKGALVFCQTQGGDQGTRAFISNLYGSSILNDDLTEYTINNENGVKALEWTVNAIKEGLLLNGSASDGTAAIDEFVAGRVSHTLLFSPGLLATKRNVIEFEPVFVPYPSPAEPQLEYLVGGYCIFDNKDAARIEASKKFIDFVANDPEWGKKNVLGTNSFPARTSMTGLYDDPEMLYNETMSKYFIKYYNTVDGFAEMRTYWFPSLQAAIGGDKTPKEALDYFVEKSNATLK